MTNFCGGICTFGNELDVQETCTNLIYKCGIYGANKSCQRPFFLPVKGTEMDICGKRLSLAIFVWWPPICTYRHH